MFVRSLPFAFVVEPSKGDDVDEQLLKQLRMVLEFAGHLAAVVEDHSVFDSIAFPSIAAERHLLGLVEGSELFAADQEDYHDAVGCVELEVDLQFVVLVHWQRRIGAEEDRFV